MLPCFFGTDKSNFIYRALAEPVAPAGFLETDFSPPLRGTLRFAPATPNILSLPFVPLWLIESRVASDEPRASKAEGCKLIANS